MVMPIVMLRLIKGNVVRMSGVQWYSCRGRTDYAEPYANVMSGVISCAGVACGARDWGGRIDVGGPFALFVLTGTSQ
jgi:hypothetical protein